MDRPMVIACLRVVLAGLAGGLTYFSFEPHGHSFAGIAGIALLWAALQPWGKASGPSVKLGALSGFVYALCLYLPLLPWVGEFVGVLPWVALSIFCALYSIVTGIFGTLLGRTKYGFIAFPFVYVAVEYALSSFPFGGFSWVRLAWGQINGPLANLAWIGGPALITFAAVLVASALATGVLVLPRKGQHGRSQSRSQALIACALVIVPLVAGAAAGLNVNKDSHTTGEVTVAAVQGNVPRLGLDFNAQRRAVLDNHVQRTHELAADLRSQNIHADLVFWPENASDVNPFRDDQARDLIMGAVEDVQAPVLVGTLTKDNVGDRNTAVVFDPVDGAGDKHHKKYLQPFGEWMPMRDFFRRFSPFVDQAGDFKPGTGNGAVNMGGYVVGVATCYEVAFDMAYRDAVMAGAQILTTPTNNATFGFTDMTYQQLAMSRLRAIETDRAVVVAATSGVSAIVQPDGSVSQHTEIFESAHLIEQLPLRDSVTIAVRYGQIIQWLLAGFGLVIMLASLFRVRRGYASKLTDEQPVLHRTQQ